MNNLKRLILSTMLMFCCSILFAQTECLGTVVDANGEPIIGASVIEKGTSNGIVTDIDAQSVANAISRLLHHPEQIEGIRQYLQTEPKGNPEEFEKFRKFVLQEPASSSGL